MNIIPAREVKRRGISAVDEALEEGPVHLVRNNRARYVVMSESDYQELMTDLAEARMAASELDLKAGRVHRGTASDLVREALADDQSVGEYSGS
jgi:PHD/YefM family antitoxin component YafN of YafNO toxin-antitoxin module